MGEHRSALPAGYPLHWYRIQTVLGQGGFGITYLAEDTNLHQQVAIKEFLPVEFALRDHDASVRPVTGERGEQYRWGLERFIAEAQTLARFKHPNIVRVFTVFRANNSAYMIMEYERGTPLAERLKGQKTLSQPELEVIAFPIMDGLQAVHAQGFIHRDIKPANIFLRDDGRPVLLDFGSARQALGEMTRTLTAMVSPGFAPFEQYTAKGDKQGPWTDIYGLGATMYRAATGKSPADAMDRSEALLHAGKDLLVPARDFMPPGYTPAFLAAVDHALAFRPADRPQSVATWLQEFADRPIAAGSATAKTRSGVTGAPTAAGDTVRIVVSAPEAPPRDAATPSPLLRYLWWGMLGGALVLIVLTVLASRVFRVDTPQAAAEPAGATAPPAPGRESPIAAPVAAEQETAPPAAAPVSESRSAPAPSAPARRTRAPPAAEPPALMQPDERARLVELQRRIRSRPRDQEARKEISELLERLNGRVREAVNVRDYPRAEAYINELLLLAPDNPRLREALKSIQQQQINGGKGS